MCLLLFYIFIIAYNAAPIIIQQQKTMKICESSIHEMEKKKTLSRAKKSSHQRDEKNPKSIRLQFDTRWNY